MILNLIKEIRNMIIEISEVFFVVLITLFLVVFLIMIAFCMEVVDRLKSVRRRKKLNQLKNKERNHYFKDLK